MTVSVCFFRLCICLQCLPLSHGSQAVSFPHSPCMEGSSYTLRGKSNYNETHFTGIPISVASPCLCQPGIRCTVVLGLLQRPLGCSSLSCFSPNSSFASEALCLPATAGCQPATHPGPPVFLNVPIGSASPPLPPKQFNQFQNISNLSRLRLPEEGEEEGTEGKKKKGTLPEQAPFLYCSHLIRNLTSNRWGRIQLCYFSTLCLGRMLHPLSELVPSSLKWG